MKQQTQTNKIEWGKIELGEVLDYEQPTKYIVESTDYRDEYETTVLTAGKSFILGYTNETKGICDKLPVIIFDDFTTDNKFVDFKFKVKSSAMKILRPKNELINIKFVFLAIQGLKFDAKRHKRYYLSAYQNLKIPMPFLNGKPNIQTQKQIVSILEKAEKLKQKRKEADTLTKEYLQSVFYEMFGDPIRNEKKWKYIETQELFDMKLGKMLSARNYTGKNLRPYLRNINVQWGHLDLSDVNEMDFDEDEYIKYQLKKGDILVCEGGEVGRTAIYNGEINNCCYQNALHRLRIKDKKINPTYFIYFMEIAVKLGLIKKDTIQVTIAHFTQDKFKRLEIPLPPLPLQQTFASIVEQVEKLKEKQKQSKEELKIMFNSLMKQAFKGELVK